MNGAPGVILEGCRPGDRLPRRGLPEWPHPHPLVEEIGDLDRHLLESSDEVLAEADDQLEREARRGPGPLLSGDARVEQQGTDLGRDPVSGPGIMQGEDLLELIEDEHRSEQQVLAPDDDPVEERLEIGCRRPRRLQPLHLACPVDRPRSHRCEGLFGRVEPDGDREVLLAPQARKEASPQERRLAQAGAPEEDKQRDAKHPQEELLCLLRPAEEQPPVLLAVGVGPGTWIATPALHGPSVTRPASRGGP